MNENTSETINEDIDNTMNQIISELDNKNLLHLSTSKIKEMKNNILQKLYLSREELLKYHKVLNKYRYVDELDEIKMCIAYKIDGKEIDYLPAAVEDQLKVKPIYKSFKGWKTKTRGIKKFDDLPKNAKNYIKELEKFIETKVSSISTSPERNDTILIVDPFKI